MTKRPLILITNDDGISAPGIKHLWQALKQHADLAIVAPAFEQSSVGLATTIRNPLHINQVSWADNAPAWSVSGTPADCIKLALSVILKNKPDLIVSGINRGTNAGRSVLYSGTVAGAIEAVFRGIPAIAFSCYDYTSPDYQAAGQCVPEIVRYVLQHSLPQGTLLNVNFPSQNLPLKGIQMARQGKGHWAENPDERAHPSEGNTYYWLGAKFLEFSEEEEGDVYLLSQGYATAVPVHVGELTDHKAYAERKHHFDQQLKFN
jgi:5'-nucleotidase